MKRLLTALLLLCPMLALAQDRYDIPQTGTKIGLTRTGINSNFLFLFISGTNSFRTAVQKGSNINFIGKSPTNAAQLDYCLTNSSGGADGNTPQGPWTNSVGGAGFALTGADYAQFTNQTFIRVGTNLLSAQGWPNVTNVAWNGASLINPADGNTPQSPLTNTLAMAGFAATGGDYLQVTNQTAFRVGTNLLAVQGWPDATNIAWNGAALINAGGSGGGGAYAYQGTNNIAPTNANGNTINAAAIATIISGGASNTIGTAANAAILSGKNNVISNQGTAYSCAVIAGGSGNIIGGDPSEPGWWGVVAGGRNNVMNGDRSNIGGGEGNRVADQVFYSAIVGGFNNTALAGYSVIGGELCNNTTLGAYSAIFGQANQSAGGWNSMPGGANNTCYAPGDYCVVSGGRNNSTIADYAVCGGGRDNEVRAEYSVVNGGYLNVIDDSASYANIAGGLSCKVSNSATYAMAAGRRAKAGHSGAFVWADSTDADFGSTAANQFLIRASGGVGINTNAPGTYALSVNGTIAGLPTFVSMGMPNGLVLAVSTALAPVTNFNSISSVGFGTNLVAGTCTIPMDGYYQINHGMSAMSGGAAKDFQIVITSNGTAIAGTRLVFTTANATYEVVRGLFNLWLTNGTIIGQSAAVLSGTDTLTFTNASININRLN